MEISALCNDNRDCTDGSDEENPVCSELLSKYTLLHIILSICAISCQCVHENLCTTGMGMCFRVSRGL